MRATTIGVLTTMALATVPAFAQTQRLPSPSRAERQVGDINDSLQRQQRNQSVNQQTQFEINSLRGQAQRNAITPPTTFGSRPGCSAGSVSC